MTAGDAAARGVQESGLGSALHSLAAAAAVADDSSSQEQQPHTEELVAQAAAAEPAARKQKRLRSLNEDHDPAAAAPAGAMQPPQLSGSSTPGLNSAEDQAAAVSAAAAAAAAAMAAAAEVMRRSGSGAGSRSLQQHGAWDAAAPAAPAAAAGHGTAAPAAPQQHWKRMRYSDANPQNLTPQQQHFYQAQQFHLRREQQQQSIGLLLDGDTTALDTLQQQQQQDDASDADAAAAAAAAAAAGGAAPDQAASGSDSLQQSLHTRLQQLLLPELGRQAILQSLDPATQCMVECGSATGIFSVDSERIMCLCSSCSEGKGPPGPEFMPSEFERHGGMAACKKWRFSIKVGAAYECEECEELQLVACRPVCVWCTGSATEVWKKIAWMPEDRGGRCAPECVTCNTML